MKHILILGGGVIGLCSAYASVRRGHRVTVLERGDPDHDSCGLQNAGMVVPSHFVPLAAPGMVAQALKWMWNPESPFYIRPRFSRELLHWGWRFWQAASTGRVNRAAPLLRDLHLASRSCFERLAADLPDDFGLARRGLLMLCKTAHALDEEARMADWARRLGLPAEVLDARQAAALDPGVRMDILGAVHFPRDCHLDPGAFLTGLTRALEQAGARFEWRAEVTGWRTRGARIEAASTSRGDFAADEYVVCGGTWSTAMARGLGLMLPIQPGKGYTLTLPNPRQMPTVCSICAEARVAVTPMGSRLRFGGTMEIAGLDETINTRRVQGIVKSVPCYFPEFRVEDFEQVPVWRGLRPCSPDGLPFLGRTARYSNCIIATGHSMIGLSLGPITGEVVGQLVSGERPAFDLRLLSPDRYA